jgi:hypothetical protein
MSDKSLSKSTSHANMPTREIQKPMLSEVFVKQEIIWDKRGLIFACIQ